MLIMGRRKSSANNDLSPSAPYNGHVKQKRASRFAEKPVQRNAANARERARMRVLSKAFCRLKTTLPWVPADTKLSKLDTLRLASCYITYLKRLLVDESENPMEEPPVHPMKLAWPLLNVSSRTTAGNDESSNIPASFDAELMSPFEHHYGPERLTC